MIFVCVYPTFKQWLNRIGRTLAVLCLNTVQTWYVPPSQPKIWRNFQKNGGVWTLETLNFRMYALPLFPRVYFRCMYYSVSAFFTAYKISSWYQEFIFREDMSGHREDSRNHIFISSPSALISHWSKFQKFLETCIMSKTLFPSYHQR